MNRYHFYINLKHNTGTVVSMCSFVMLRAKFSKYYSTVDERVSHHQVCIMFIANLLENFIIDAKLLRPYVSLGRSAYRYRCIID